MTKCNHEAFSFSNCCKRQVKGNFACGSISSNGGALLLREVDRRMGLTEAWRERSVMREAARCALAGGSGRSAQTRRRPTRQTCDAREADNQLMLRVGLRF